MALTRDFKETIRARVKRDPGFRKALLREGIENFLSGDVETGKIILRDFINATVGFTKLSDVTHRSAKSLMRMLGPRGNPQARNLFEIVAYLQHAEGVRFEVRSTRTALRTKRHGHCRRKQNERLQSRRTVDRAAHKYIPGPLHTESMRRSRVPSLRTSKRNSIRVSLAGRCSVAERSITLVGSLIWAIIHLTHQSRFPRSRFWP